MGWHAALQPFVIPREQQGRHDRHSRDSPALTCILEKESRWRQGHSQKIFLRAHPLPVKEASDQAISTTVERECLTT